MTDKATPRPWLAVHFTKPDNSQIQSAQDVADTLSASALKSGNAYLFGVVHDDGTPDCDGFVVCHTGNGELSENNADLIVAAVNSYSPDKDEKVRALVEAATKLSKQDTMHRNEPCALVNASDLNGLRKALRALGETA